ncbi:TPA: DNA topoisomerase I [Candidatus Uhrbacteria bacterium]|nr:DNA topoisomerase I [Candidatus Uhrbacteria bacterium]
MKLIYTTDDKLGIGRRKRLGFFVYVDAQGKRVRDREVLTRIKALGIPPAYTNVWICPVANGHLQATGRDSKGRKQYIYHELWTAEQESKKFHKLLDFAKSLSPIRRIVARDFALLDMPKERVLAAIVKLLDNEYVRIGNDEYAEENGTYGLTTLENRHVKGVGEKMRLVFKGKEGIVHEVPLHDERLREVVAACQDIPGHELFEYVDDNGAVHDIKSTDVNEYLQEMAKREVTAKDFRTWHGTVIVAEYLWKVARPESKKELRLNIKEAINKAAEALGNTSAVCKRSYVHPGVIACYEKDSLKWREPKESSCKKYPHLKKHEVALVEFLERG